MRVATPWLAVAALLAHGCASTSDQEEAMRRRQLVLVPEEATPVDTLSWRRIDGVEGLNERMLLIQTRDRPYLLTLSRPCAGVSSRTRFLSRDVDMTFDPGFDDFLAIQAGSALDVAAYPLPIRGTARLSETQIVESTMPCRSDTLYALREEDVAVLRAAVAPPPVN